MYSQERPLSGIAASVMGLLGSVPILPTLMPWATLKPLAVEDVAKAILAAIKKSEIVYSVSGKQEVFEIGDLEILAKEPVVQAS